MHLFDWNSQCGSPRCGLSAHSVVRLAVVPLSGGRGICFRFSRCKHTRKVRKLCTPLRIEKKPVLNKARPSPVALENTPPQTVPGTHQRTHRRSPLSGPENRTMRKCLVILRKARRPTAVARIALTLTNGALYLGVGRFGSANRIRTKSLLVNRSSLSYFSASADLLLSAIVFPSPFRFPTGLLRIQAVDHCGVAALVHSRPLGRLVGGSSNLVLQEKSGTRASRADQGSRPTNFSLRR